MNPVSGDAEEKSVGSTALLVPPNIPPHGEVRLPGSKSFSNRALILSALAPGRSRIHLHSLSDDTELVIRALTQSGVVITERDGSLVVRQGSPSPFRGEIDLGAAGTAMRFLTAFFAVLPGCEVVLSGTERMHRRPIGELVDALRVLGGDIEYLAENGSPPIRIRGLPLRGGTLSLTGKVSSQFISALLLVAPVMSQGLTITLEDSPVSHPYIDMTLQTLRAFGVRANWENDSVLSVSPGLIQATDFSCEGDASGGSYFFSVAAVTGGAVRVNNVDIQSVQGDSRFPVLLEKMGCSVLSGRDGAVPWIEVSGSENLLPLEVDMSGMPDVAQTLAVVCSQANGTSHLAGLGTLRHKETDRIVATVSELKRLGVRCECGSDWITVHGPVVPQPGCIHTYDDHRMAMSFAVLGAKYPGIQIQDPGVVSKSFPSFWDELSGLGLSVKFCRSEVR